MEEGILSIDTVLICCGVGVHIFCFNKLQFRFLLTTLTQVLEVLCFGSQTCITPKILGPNNPVGTHSMPHINLNNM